MSQITTLQFDPEPHEDEAFRRAMHRTLTSTEDYTRRIHWWVRLFGIIWIVIPIVATVVMVFFFVGTLAGSETVDTSSSYSRCMENPLFTAAECARWYTG